MEYKRVEALLELSGFHDVSDVGKMVTMVQNAPDPETAVCHVMGVVRVESPILQTKWRKHVSQMWFASHPRVPTSFALPLKSGDISYAHVLLEVQSLLEEISIAPITIERTNTGVSLAVAEEARLMQALPAFRGEIGAIRRMLALLEELHLVRMYREQVQVVRSRRKLFESLPITGQFYLLWHSDMYHMEWRQFDERYGGYLSIFQQYLPMVWEMFTHRHEGTVERIDEVTWQIARAFRPLWQQQNGMFAMGRGSMIGLYEQSLLEQMIETHLLQKSLARYGLITYEDDISFSWTAAGESLLNAEREGSLPCTADLLS